METETKMMPIGDILIPEHFDMSPPKREKIDSAIAYYQEHGCLDTPLTVAKDSILVDGYSRFLALKELGVEEAECQLPYLTLVSTHFDPKGKEYVWKIPKGMEVHIGDALLVPNVVNGRKFKRKIIAERIYQSNSSNDYYHRQVIAVLPKEESKPQTESEVTSE